LSRGAKAGWCLIGAAFTTGVLVGGLGGPLTPAATWAALGATALLVFIAYLEWTEDDE
jgi:hypothetical protein